MVTSGDFCWCNPSNTKHPVHEYEPHDPVYLITPGSWGRVVDIPLQLVESDVGTHARHPVWEIIGSIVGWHIWKAHCSQVLEGKPLQ